MPYSDADLSAAIRSSRSWRGVLRHLGLPPTSAGAMRTARRRANSLALNHSHFTGQRRYSDQELADAVHALRSWTAVLRHLGLTEGGRNLSSVRGHAVRLALDIGHLESPRVAPDPDFTRAAGSQFLRSAAPSLAAAWFQLRGWTVSWPLEPCRYDLLVERDGRCSRIQVKTTVAQASTRGIVSLSTSRRVGHETYQHDEIDYFFVIDLILDAYLIPVTTVAGRFSICLSRYRSFVVAERGQWLTGPPSACASPAP